MAAQSNAVPVKTLYAYKVGTDWFGIQEFRQQTYMRWAEILKEHGIDPAQEAFTMQASPEDDYRQIPGSIGEEAYGADAIYLKVAGISPTGRSPYEAWLASKGQPFYDLFKIQQRLGLVSKLGYDSEVDWEAYVLPYVGRVRGAYEEAWRILGTIYGLTPEQREQVGLSFDTKASGDIEELQNLVGLALGAKYIADVATGIASNVPAKWRAWAAVDESETFLDYLRRELWSVPLF